MPSKTPNFDRALDEYFSKLELDEKGGQWRVCRFSGEKFYVRPEDVAFYKKIRVPLPTLSPHERIRLLLAFWNSYNLFNGTSAFSGKKIIMQYAPNTPYKIYEHQHWFGGDWDAIEYGRNCDPAKKFFEQFLELQLVVPRPSLFVDNTSTNSDYTNDSVHLKDCYLVFNSNNSENCHYSISPIRSRDSVDCFDIFDSTRCYECFESHELYNCFFVEFSRNCLDSYFLYDCRNCTNCFGGINLRHKKYIFFGEQLTKEEYENKTREVNLGNRDILSEYKRKFFEMIRGAIHKPHHNEKSVNSSGDYILKSRNCFNCYFVEDSERSAYSIGCHKIRDCYDVSALNTEYSYQCSGAENVYKALFSKMAVECRNLEYSDFCTNCHDVFGCIALKNKSFCILNKQYEENEYWEELDRIKTKMLRDEEYGEFFPPELSPFPYNISIATSYKGYDDFENARRFGYRFEDIKEEITSGEEENIINAEEVPADIKNVGDDILDRIIFDRENNKKFRYTKVELDLHRKYNMPLPREHFSPRLKEKRDKFGSIVLEFFERVCPKCGARFQTVYAPSDPRIVYCESCYLREIV